MQFLNIDFINGYITLSVFGRVSSWDLNLDTINLLKSMEVL